MKTDLGQGNFVDLDTKGLEKILAGLKSSLFVDIGILGNAGGNKEDGITIAGIGAVHEFGTMDGRIPKRSFIVAPLNYKKLNLEKRAEKSMTEKMPSGDIEGIFSDIGIEAEVAIQEAFETGGFGQWAPLKPETKANKGSSAILIDTGELRKAVTSKVGK